MNRIQAFFRFIISISLIVATSGTFAITWAYMCGDAVDRAEMGTELVLLEFHLLLKGEKDLVEWLSRPRAEAPGHHVMLTFLSHAIERPNAFHNVFSRMKKTANRNLRARFNLALRDFGIQPLMARVAHGATKQDSQPEVSAQLVSHEPAATQITIGSRAPASTGAMTREHSDHK